MTGQIVHKALEKLNIPGFSLAVTLALVLCALSAPVSSASLYKWIDENGQVRYSDRLPPNQVKKKHQQLSKQGVVLSTTEDARSEEEIAEELEKQQALESERAEQARLKQIQDKKDQVLLLTFSSAEEIDLAREDRLAVVDSVIRLIEKSIASTQKKLDELQANADEVYLSQGKEVPGGLAQKIEHFTRKIENREAQLELKLDEKAKINARFDSDLERFRLLKSEQN